jgi:hypothetical protein
LGLSVAQFLGIHPVPMPRRRIDCHHRATSVTIWFQY